MTKREAKAIIEADRALIRWGAEAARRRIRRAQAGALRNLRVLLAEEITCAAERYAFPGCKGRKHAEDCPRGIFLEALRELRAATKSEHGR